MWKKRESHLLDIYKNNKSKDDFLLPLATTSKSNSNDGDKNTLYSCSNMSQSYPSLLLTTTTTTNEPAKITKRHSTNAIYQGNEFDVFGKDQLEEHFAPLYSIEQFTPTTANPRIERYLKGEILLRTEQEFKRGQIEAMINDTSNNIKRRKTFNSSETEDVTLIDGVFMKSTAPVNTPAASIFFVKDNNSHPEDDDLAYY